MRHPLLLSLCLLLGCAESELPAPVSTSAHALPEAALRAIAAELRERAGVPGVLLGVRAHEQMIVVADGSEDLLGLTPLDPARPFRVGSLTKMYTGALVMRAVERGELALDDTLDHYVPGFPEASSITLDMLLSHTGGVTTKTFDDATLLAELTADLTRVWSADDVISRMRSEPPFGPPGQSGMQYSNTGFVLLGKIASVASGAPLEQLYRRELLEPLGLVHTRYTFESSPTLLPGWLELGGAPLDASRLPQQSILSFAGAAGAMESTVEDTLRFLSALFEQGRVVAPSSLATLHRPAAPDAWYGRALMRFCPCEPAPEGLRYTGFGHGGHVPGYWSVAVHYPAHGVSVVALINRDAVQGVMLERGVFDPTLAAVLDAVSGAEQGH